MWVWLLFGNAVDSNVRICLQDGQPSASGFRILSDIQLVSDADPNPYVGIVWDDGDVQARLAKCMRCAALLKVPVGNLRIRDAEKACSRRSPTAKLRPIRIHKYFLNFLPLVFSLLARTWDARI